MKKRKAVLLLLIVLTLCLIWGNSLLSGQTSGQISGGLFQKLMALFPRLSWLTEHRLRKLGHFTEYAVLGLLLTWFLILKGQRGGYRVAMPLLFGTLTANLDEAIQTISPQRGPSVLDVWLDVGGVCTGIGVLLLFRWIITRKGITR